MAYPPPQDYQEAVQNPKFCFADPTLRQSVAETNPIGLPKPISGTFGSVYKLARGSEKHAVKCFFNQYDDQQQRYARISGYLNQVNLPYTVDFDYVVQGIRVRGSWYPILMMDWVDGVSLDRYVQQHVGDRRVLEGLDAQFLAMVASFRANHIAHGDLQHGNILVVDDRLKVIDYDGMYVPDLRGCVGHETGHPNYQHPRRKPGVFDENMDEFSAEVIHLSLIALEQKPALWRDFNGGDECLLLRRADFTHPETSGILRDLTRSANEQVRTTSIALMDFAMGAPQKNGVPSMPSKPRSEPTPGGIPAWMQPPVVRVEKTEAKREIPQPPSLTLPPERALIAWKRLDAADWLHAQYPALPRVCFTSPAPRSRAMLFLTVCSWITAGVLYAASPASLLVSALVALGAAAVLVLVARTEFTRSPELCESLEMQERAKTDQEERHLLQQQLDGMHVDYIQVLADEKRSLEGIVADYASAVLVRQSNQMNALKQLDNQRDALRKHLERGWPGVDVHHQTVPTQRELRLELDGFEILDTSIVGIGSYLRQQLLDHGIANAGDILDVHIDQPTAEEYAYVWFRTTTSTRCHVPGIGPEKARAIKQWQQKIDTYVGARAAAKAAYLRSDDEVRDKIGLELTWSRQAFEASYRKNLDLMRGQQRTTVQRIDAIGMRKAQAEARAVELNRQMLEDVRGIAAHSGIRFGPFLKRAFFGSRK